MTQKQKGLVGLGVMVVLAGVVMFGSDKIGRTSKETASYTAGTYIGKAEGYGGEVIATVTVTDKKIETVNFAGVDETPAIGGAALEQLTATFIEQQSSQVDVVSGATITSNAAMKAVEDALSQASGKTPVRTIDTTVAAESKTNEAVTEDETEDPSSYYFAEGTYTTTSDGYGGEVMAEVVISEDGKIEEVILTGAKETPEIGGKALPKLAKLFVDQQSTDVDVISGATITSEAAIEAVEFALDEAKQYLEGSHEGEDLSELSLANGTFTGSYKGYGGDVVAEVMIVDGKIDKLSLAGKDETPDIGGAALKKLEIAFVKNQSSEVDIISGATKTSDAAIEAVEEALAKAEEAFEEQ